MRRSGVFAALALAAGCAESGTGPEGAALTRGEALAIAASVAESGERATTGSVNGASASAAGTTASPPREITVSRTTSHPCPAEGRIAIALNATVTFDGEARAFALDADGVLTHDDCGFVHEGVTLVVDGDPDLHFEAHAAAADGMPSEPWTSQASGAFRWSASDGRSGRCDVAVTTVTDFAARSRTVDGEVCGHTIHEVVRWN